MSNAPGTLGTTSASGQLGNTTAGVVTYVNGSPQRWLGVGGGEFSIAGSTITLEAIGGGQPDQMIAPAIGNGGTYTNVNNGFRNFNPYVIGPAMFTLALSGVTTNTTITSAVFSFGTGPDTFLTGSCTSGCSGAGAGGGSGGAQNVVPEPMSLLLLGSGLAWSGIKFRRRR